MILGTWDSPDEYRLWGAYKDDPKVTAYNEWIRLKEVYRPGITESKRQRKSHTLPSEDEDFPQPKRRHTTVGR